MTIVLTTDVFCDGADGGCSEWTRGVTGPRSRAADARREARRVGWTITKAGDFCPACARTVIAKAEGKQ
jgi:hypothetical protein